MIADDLTPFFATADFAESCTIGGVTGVGIFANDYVAVDVGSPVAMASTEPALTIRASDFPAVARGTAVVVRGVNYTVYGPPEPDGAGVVLLRLRKT